jgi:Ca2+/H+ antiporter
MKNIFKKNNTETTNEAMLMGGTTGVVMPFDMSREQLQTYSNTVFTVSAAMSVASMVVGGVGLVRQAKKNKRLKAEEEAAKAAKSEAES